MRVPTLLPSCPAEGRRYGGDVDAVGGIGLVGTTGDGQEYGRDEEGK